MDSQIPTSVIEQLRTQDGQLFQDEEILSLFLDLKCFVWTFLSSAIRTNSLDGVSQKFLAMSHETAQETQKNFLALRPTALDDFQNAIEKQQSLIRKKKVHVLVEEKTIYQVIQGIFKRVLQNDFLKTSQKEDPIKLDFVFREAFRLSMHHDCSITLVIQNEDTQKTLEKPIESDSAEDLHVDLHLETEEAHEQVIEDVIQELANENLVDKDEVKVFAETEVVEDIQQDVEKPESDDEDIAPLRDNASVVSRAMSALSSLSQIRKPRVRTVIFDDDDRSSRFTKK